MSDVFSYWFCTDCTLTAVNGEPHPTPEAFDSGWSSLVEDLGGSQPAFDSTTDREEFSTVTCECCGSSLGGSRYRFTAIPA